MDASPESLSPAQSDATTVKPSSMKMILIIAGILELIFPLLALYILFQLSILQQSVEVNGSLNLAIGYFGFVLAVALLQILIGIFSLEKRFGSMFAKAVFVVGIILAIFTIPALLIFIIMPIYQLTNSF